MQQHKHIKHNSDGLFYYNGFDLKTLTIDDIKGADITSSEKKCLIQRWREWNIKQRTEDKIRHRRLKRKIMAFKSRQSQRRLTIKYIHIDEYYRIDYYVYYKCDGGLSENMSLTIK